MRDTWFQSSLEEFYWMTSFRALLGWFFFNSWSDCAWKKEKAPLRRLHKVTKTLVNRKRKVVRSRQLSDHYFFLFACFVVVLLQFDMYGVFLMYIYQHKKNRKDMKQKGIHVLKNWRENRLLEWIGVSFVRQHYCSETRAEMCA